MGVAVSAEAQQALRHTTDWMVNPYGQSQQQSMLVAIWELVRPFLTQVPDDLLLGIQVHVKTGLISPAEGSPPSAFGLWRGREKIVEIVHPDVLRRFGFVVDLSKVFVIIVGHELVHAWQSYHRHTLLRRMDTGASRDRSVDESCFWEGHATMVMTAVSNHHGLWLQNETGLALLRFRDSGRDAATVCYYKLSKKYAAALKAWANLDDDAHEQRSVWVVQYDTDPWRPQAIVARKVHSPPEFATHFSASHQAKAPLRTLSTHAALAGMARRELAGLPLPTPKTPKEKRQAALYATRRDETLASAAKTRPRL